MKIPIVQTLREEILKGYGSHCVWCNESIQEFLTLTNKTLAPLKDNSHETYLRLKRLHYPKSYMLLCWNCKAPRIFLKVLQSQIDSGRYTEQEAEQFLGLREEARIIYGSKCTCCGETRPESLIIKHLGKYLTKLGGYDELLAIKKLNWPKKQFRLLCHNCSRGTIGDKTCPHEFNK